MKKICQDLRAECEALKAILKDISTMQWQQKTPFKDWTIFDQVEHLHFFDQQGIFSIKEPKSFILFAKQFMEKATIKSFVELARAELGTLTPQQLLEKWSNGFNNIVDCLENLSPEQRMPWFGPEMSAISFASARLMETWAHGQSILDALKIQRKNTDRLRYIAELGVKTFSWSFKGKGLSVPEIKPFVELTAPSGEIWRWNDPQSSERLTGSAVGFCQLVTQTRNIADTDLVIQGINTLQWVEIAQCFAGLPSKPPVAGIRNIKY